MTADELERECIDLVLTLDALGDGRGPRAFDVYQRALSARARPVLLRQRGALGDCCDALDARAAATGQHWSRAAADEDMQQQGAAADAAAVELETGAQAAFAEALERLRALAKEATHED
jgi:hypothetical protein